MTNYIQLAIPFFFVAILLESLYSGLRKKNWVNWQDAFANLACGSVEQIFELTYKSALLAVYIWLYQSASLPHLGLESVWVWLSCFILVDFGYYWFHRASHRIHLIWSGHGPHHQSEEYNLTVALRQGAFERSFSWLFWLPLALLGFDPVMYVACVQFNNIYQFFIHTRAVKQLGPLEWIFNTPSHHRVHHGKNPEYIDKNYGGMFIIWDRIFGTFEPERAEPVYGTVTPFQSWNPIWANLVFFRDMYLYMQGLPWSQKLQVIWRPPGWKPSDPEPSIPEVDAATYQKYQVPTSPLKIAVSSVLFVSLLLMATVYLEQVKVWGLSMQLLAGCGLIAGFSALSWAIEKHKQA